MACTPCARSRSAADRTSASFQRDETRPLASRALGMPTRRRAGQERRRLRVHAQVVHTGALHRTSSSTSSKPTVCEDGRHRALLLEDGVGAMVVPWISARRSPGLHRERQHPVTAAPMPSSRSFGVLGTLVSASRPARSRATMSVKVPRCDADLHRAPPSGRLRVPYGRARPSDVLDVNRVGAIPSRGSSASLGVRRVVTTASATTSSATSRHGPKRFLFVGHYDTVFASGTAKQAPVFASITPTRSGSRPPRREVIATGRAAPTAWGSWSRRVRAAST